MRVASLQSATTGAVRPALTLLVAAVGLVLLLGAVNLGTLVLGRSIERARELAVRTAVGASRRQLVRQLLVEQGVLALTGGLAGLGLANAMLPAFIARLPAEVPRQREIALDAPVFAAVLAASVGLALLMAVLPALVALRPGLQPLLRQHQSTDTPGRQRALGGLVAAQVALAAGARHRRRADAALDVAAPARRSRLRGRAASWRSACRPRRSIARSRPDCRTCGRSATACRRCRG